jgi:hypothetical protein
MNYAPNFTDPRVVTAVKRALTFVEQYTRSQQVNWFSSRELYRHFGNTSKPLGRYLKQNMLTVTDKYYNSETGVCMKYTRNDQGIQQIKEATGLVDFLPQLTPKLEQQLTTGEFEYLDKSNRSYNPLQFISKRVRGSLLANHGYTYNYDIEAAAPTLLIQKARKLNPSLELVHLEYYTNNRSQVRKEIALECEITEPQVKEVINGVLQGGVVSCWQSSKLFQALNFNYNSVKNLQNNEKFKGISKDIGQMWLTLKQDFPVRYLIDKNGKSRRQRLSARQKSELYRLLEEEVGVITRRYLKKIKVKCLWMHDGWCCDKFVVPSDVELEVKRATGYSVKLEWNKYED